MSQIHTIRKLPLLVAIICMSLVFGYFQNCSEVSFSEKVANSTVGEDSSSGALDTPTSSLPDVSTPSDGAIPVDGTVPPTDSGSNPSNGDDPFTQPPTGTDPGGDTGNNSTPNAPTDVVNPFDNTAPTPTLSGSGIKGNLFYLTNSHRSLFNNDLNNARIDDYRIYGVSVPVNVVMTSINITPRPWDSGFFTGTGNIVQKEDGEALFEWFHIDLAGFISLPAGNYQFAMISDDGMRVTIDDNVILNDDGVHAPRWKCATQNINFDGTTKKRIRVQYFQGPRTQIAMQLLIRPESRVNSACRAGEGFENLPAGAFSH